MRFNTHPGTVDWSCDVVVVLSRRSVKPGAHDVLASDADDDTTDEITILVGIVPGRGI